MEQSIEETVEALVRFTAKGSFPVPQAFRWRNRRFDIAQIEQVCRCPSDLSVHEEGPLSYGHFSSRWVRGSDTHPTHPRATKGSLCYRVRTKRNRFDLRLDLERSQWVLETLLGDAEVDTDERASGIAR
jgi:hypothetical protein